MTAKTRRATPNAASSATQEPLSIDFALNEGGLPRHMAVRMPTPEQLAVWASVGEQFTRLGAEWAHQNAAVADLDSDHPDVVGVRTTQNRQAIRGIGRGVKLIKSVLADEADHEWVDDAIMEGATLEQMLGIVSLATNAARKRAATSAPTDDHKSKAALSE